MIYKKIKELAQKKKISISELERRAGLSNGSICKWNNVSPNINNLKALAWKCSLNQMKNIMI